MSLVSEALDELGVNSYDDSGKLKTLDVLLIEVARAFAGHSPSRVQYISTVLFGQPMEPYIRIITDLGCYDEAEAKA
jgi:hypothetical protein